MNVLRLIRLPNLLILVLAQVLIRHCLILPAFTAEYFITGVFPAGLSEFQFACLVFSTVLIAAAGYIINDMYDTGIDAINKPGRVLIGNVFPERQALLAYRMMTVLGCLLGFYLAIAIQKPMLGFIHVFASASLWIYASQWKRRFLAGNILVAFLSALGLLIVGLFEPGFYPNIHFLLVYAGFAFAVSLIREIIKDMEDVEGDERGQVKSLPIRWGMKRARLVVMVLILLTSWALMEVLHSGFYNSTKINFRNLLIACELPFAILLYLVATASEKKDYSVASGVTKIIMLLGIGTLIPLYFLFIKATAIQ